MILAMVWPWAGPIMSVRRISMSSVPCNISCSCIGRDRFIVRFSPLGRLWEIGYRIVHSNVEGRLSSLLSYNSTVKQTVGRVALASRGEGWMFFGARGELAE